MHYFGNFKGFESTRLDLFQPLTVLIGPNGSGKSNAIEGIELLSYIAHGGPLHQISDVGRGGNGLEIRGGLQSCPKYGQSFSLAQYGQETFSLGFSAHIRFDGELRPFLYNVAVRPKPHPRIATERFAFLDPGPMIFETIGTGQSVASGDIKVRYNNFARGGKKPVASISANQSVLSQYAKFAVKNKNKYEECVQLVEGMMHYLRRSFVFDPRPSLMRTYEQIGNSILSKNGFNLSAVLHALKEGPPEGQETLARLLGWLKQLPEEPYQGFDFVTTELNHVIFGLKEGSEERLVDAGLLSDGTLRCLAVLTALETAEEGSRVIIEELDNGLHPSRVKVLTAAIEDCCERRKLNVMVTTHNPATLDALSQDQLKGVVICAWDQAQQAFKLVRLFDLPRHVELLERGRLGDLMTRRIFEQYLAPTFEEDRKEEALDWLHSLP